MGKKIPLHSIHAQSAHMGEFAGFEMPIWYEGIIKEVLNTRERASVFDVSHMGRFIIEGEGGGAFLDYVTTARISGLGVNQGRYCLMCNEQGGVVDDAIVFRVGDEKFLFVGNASRREADLGWLRLNATKFGVRVSDASDSSLMLALQGPESERLLQEGCERELPSMRRFTGDTVNILGEEVFLTRTGYTGEDGFELISFNPAASERIWRGIVNLGFAPAGLGARDVLRIEAGLPLYGKELDESTDPFDAGLEFAVAMEKNDFLGKKALEEKISSGRRRFLVGIVMQEGGIPREGYPIIYDGREAGKITSGTFSPIVGAGIGMGYVGKGLEPDAQVLVGIRGRLKQGKISKLPFYDTRMYGYRRVRKG